MLKMPTITIPAKVVAIDGADTYFRLPVRVRYALDGIDVTIPDHAVPAMWGGGSPVLDYAHFRYVMFLDSQGTFWVIEESGLKALQTDIIQVYYPLFRSTYRMWLRWLPRIIYVTEGGITGSGSGPWCVTWESPSSTTCDICDQQWTVVSTPGGWIPAHCSASVYFSATTAVGVHFPQSAWQLYLQVFLISPRTIHSVRVSVSDFSSNPFFLYMYDIYGTLIWSTQAFGSGGINWNSGGGPMIPNVAKIVIEQSGGDRDWNSPPTCGDIKVCGPDGGSPFYGPWTTG